MLPSKDTEPEHLIKALIEREIGNDWSHTNSHGCNLRHCLVEPVKRPYKNSFKNGEILNLWLVLEEFPENPSTGYKIIFDEQENQFGLICDGIFIGYYGSFMTTFDGM